MKSQLSRRDFLKLGGLTLGGLAFSPFIPGLTNFDDSFVVRIATAEMPVRKDPTDDSRIELSWYRDELVHVYEEVKAEEPKHNPVWYRTWGGYIHRGRLQRVNTLYQIPLSSIPEGNGRLEPGQVFGLTPAQGLAGPLEGAGHPVPLDQAAETVAHQHRGDLVHTPQIAGGAESLPQNQQGLPEGMSAGRTAGSSSVMSGVGPVLDEGNPDRPERKAHPRR